MLQVHVRGKGRKDFVPTELSFSDAEKLNKGEGWKIQLVYDQNKVWSVSLPRFDTKGVSEKNGRYFIRTKYNRVLDLVNQLVDPIAKYIDDNREKLGVTKTHTELQEVLKRDIFVARTIHTNVFFDHEKQNAKLHELKPGVNVKVSAKPVLYVRENEAPYIDFEITRTIISPKSERKTSSTHVVKSESQEVKVKPKSQVVTSTH